MEDNKKDEVMEVIADLPKEIPKEDTVKAEEIAGESSMQEAGELVKVYSEPTEEELVKLHTDTKAEEGQERDRIKRLLDVSRDKAAVVQRKRLNDLYSEIITQVEDRVANRPHEISTKDYIALVQVVSNQVEKTQQVIENTPTIQVNQQNITVNVNEKETPLDRESRERVMRAVQDMLNLAKQQQTVVEAEVIENIEEEESDGD